MADNNAFVPERFIIQTPRYFTLSPEVIHTLGLNVMYTLCRNTNLKFVNTFESLKDEDKAKK